MTFLRRGPWKARSPWKGRGPWCAKGPFGGNETPAQVLELETGDQLLTEDGGLILLES
jgi:hypothetical protein